MFEGMRLAKSAPALVLVSALALAGCSSTTESATEEMVENLIESGTGNEVEIDDDSMSMTDEEGGGFAAGDEVDLPPAFPTDVPLFTYGTRVWTYQMTSPDLEVAVSATIAEGDSPEDEDSLVSVSGTYTQ